MRAGQFQSDVLAPIWRRALTSAKCVARRRLSLLALLIIAACWRPYRGLDHDATLYGLQVLNQAENGALSTDLFLHFGSQDSRSGFSQCFAPLARICGVQATFLLGFVLCQLGFLDALRRLFRHVSTNRATVGLALLVAAALPIGYGRLGIFSVNESFFTARSVAEVAVLYGIVAALSQRCIATMALMAFGAWMHPIIALPGIFIALYLVGRKWFSEGFLWTALGMGVVAFALSLAVPSWGRALYGDLPIEWKLQISATNPYCFPAFWSWTSWEWLAGTLLIGVFALASCRSKSHTPPLVANENKRRLLTASLCIATLGTMLACLAPQLPYALPLQAQPYRNAWILHLLAIPAGIDLARTLWRRQSAPSRIAAFSCGAFLLFMGAPSWKLVAVAATLAFTLGHLFQKPAKVGTAVFWSATTVLTLLLTIVAVGALAKMTLTRGHFLQGANVWLLGLPAGVMPLLILSVSLLAVYGGWQWIGQAVGHRWRQAILGTTLALVLGGSVYLTTTPWCGRRGPAREQDIAFVTQTVRELSDRQWPTIHWPNNSAADIWFRVGAQSFLALDQTAGGLFSRATSAEIERRTKLTAVFDVPYLMALRSGSLTEQLVPQLYRVSADELPDATSQDLLRLCLEPGLDFVVLPTEFVALAPRSNGRWYIYDCCRVKAPLLADVYLSEL